MTTNIFGPGHHPSSNETTARPAQTSTGSSVDTFFAQCDADGDGGTNIDEMWLNIITQNFRQLVRTAGAAQSETSDDMVAEAAARYGAGGGDYLVDSGSANNYVILTPGQFKPPLALFPGMRTRFLALNAPTGASVLNAFGLGNKALLRPDGTAIQNGDFAALAMLETFYDPTAAAGAGGHRTCPWAMPQPATGVPEGYLTMLAAGSGGPMPTSDLTAQTNIYYSPDAGNGCPIWNGNRFVRASFAETSLALVASHVANVNYDGFAFLDPGDLTTFKVGTGPAWNTSTAGAGARGTGAGTTELERVNGLWVNKVAATMRNGSATFSVGARMATFLGSLRMSGTNGQISVTPAFGQSRIWPIWNCYNRKPLRLKAGPATASWSYNVATIRPSNNDTANSLSFMIGIAEEFVRARFTQATDLVATNPGAGQRNYIGWNSTTAGSGRSGSRAGTSITASGELSAEHAQVAPIGLHTVTALESAGSLVSSTFHGSEADYMLSAEWRG